MKKIILTFGFCLTLHYCTSAQTVNSNKANLIIQDKICTMDSIRSASEIIRALIGFRGPLKVEGTNAAVITPTSPFRLVVPYAFDSADLNEQAKRQLDELGIALHSEVLEGVNIELAGYTDERGSQEYNLILSQNRVNNAKNFLVTKHNIDPEQIVYVGYGESKQLIRNAKTEPEHAINRRVEVKKITEKEAMETREKYSFSTIEYDPSNRKNLSSGDFHVKDGIHHMIQYDAT